MDLHMCCPACAVSPERLVNGAAHVSLQAAVYGILVNAGLRLLD